MDKTSKPVQEQRLSLFYAMLQQTDSMPIPFNGLISKEYVKCC